MKSYKPLEKLDIRIISPNDGGDYRDMVSLLNLLLISPNFIAHVQEFRDRFKLKGNEFTKEDIDKLSEEAYSDWDPKKHPFIVKYNFTKHFDHDKAMQIYMESEALIEMMLTSDTYSGIKHLLSGAYYILSNLILTNKVELAWDYNNGISIYRGQLLGVVKENVYIEINKNISINQLINHIKANKKRLDSMLADISQRRAPSEVIFKEYEIEILRYGYGTGRGKYLELDNIVDTYKVTYPELKGKDYTSASYRYVFNELKERLKRLGLEKLFVR